jgi:hypothetical protein
MKSNPPVPDDLEQQGDPRVRIRRRDLAAGLAVVVAVISGSYVAALALPSDRGSVFAAVATGVATIILAALTALLLQLNLNTIAEMRRATDATRRATDATRAAALATEREAAATEGSTRTLHEQLEREWRPMLVLDHIPLLGLVEEAGEHRVSVQLSNLGRGPAVNVLVYLTHEKTESVWRSPLVHVPAGESIELRLKPAADPRNDMFDKDPPQSRVAILCEDQSGAWHRFSRNEPVPDSYRGMVDRSDSWVDFYANRLNRLPPR